MRDARWPELLARTIEEWRSRSFRWGRVDCCQFVGEAVLAMTGVDYRHCFPKYASKREAIEILSSANGQQGLAEAAFGPAKHPAIAADGDVVMLIRPNGLALGICLGVQCVAPGPKGLVFVPRGAALAAWSI